MSNSRPVIKSEFIFELKKIMKSIVLKELKDKKYWEFYELQKSKYGLLKTEENIKKIYPAICNPHNLTNEMVILIGLAYLDQYPSPDPDKTYSCSANIFNLFKSNASDDRLHPYAHELTKCNKDTSEARWLFLLDQFNKQPKQDGPIAVLIINLFINAFNRVPNIYDYSLTGCFKPSSMLDKEKIYENLKEIVDSYYKRAEELGIEEMGNNTVKLGRV